MISLENWFFFIKECTGGFLMTVHTTTVLAYLPELTTNDEETSHYNSRFSAIKCIGLEIYLLTVTGVSRIVKAEPVTTAKIAPGLALGDSSILLSYSWIFLFNKRTALSEVPEGTNLMSCGFRKVRRTCHMIFTQYRSLF